MVNRHIVAIRGPSGQRRIEIIRQPVANLTRDDALNLAAWLVAMAEAMPVEDGGLIASERFAQLYDEALEGKD